MSDELEQRVRTMCGWVGVEISKSRVRTPGRAGYGLWRVRSAAERHWHVPHPKIGPDGEWTDYLFRLEEIEPAVRAAIGRGTHAGPGELHLVEAGAAVKTGDFGYAAGHVVPTRWTSAYRGRRDLGLAAYLKELERTGPAVGAASAPLDETVREIVTRSTVRSRQRAANAEFQTEHLRRRAYGLRARYAAKRARDSVQTDRSDL